jgi:hypothetical protein
MTSNNTPSGRGQSGGLSKLYLLKPSAPPVRRITVNMLEVKVLNNKSLANWLALSHALAGAIL